NAAARLNGMSYSAFIAGMNEKGLELNRKVLADLAVHNPNTFAELVKSIQK
ncbi:MAG: 50S ribosomal protein L20, partial [Planctomycetia bacterium]|nr:50S ribosomal protein L20 [Planctomycetia bacterium]